MKWSVKWRVRGKARLTGFLDVSTTQSMLEWLATNRVKSLVFGGRRLSVVFLLAANDKEIEEEFTITGLDPDCDSLVLVEDAIRQVKEILQSALTEKGMIDWIMSENVYLGASPIDVYLRGDKDRLLAAAQAYVDGVYL